MSNDWINRLTVRGPATDARSFATAATDPRIVKRQVARPSRAKRSLGLSFRKLLERLPERVKARLYPEVTEPWELSVDAPVRLEQAMVERTYRFQLTHYEPDTLLIEVSNQYPQLCFVLGWVDPNSDDQASRFIHAGRSSLYRLSLRRKRALQVGVPKDGEADDSEIFMADVHADWAMMDAVVCHWDRRSAAVLRRIAQDIARLGPQPGRRRRTVN